MNRGDGPAARSNRFAVGGRAHRLAPEPAETDARQSTTALGKARARAPSTGRLQRLVEFDGDVPSISTLWVIAYAALFLIRPWEVLVPPLEPLRLQTVGVLLLLARVALARDAHFDVATTAPIGVFVLGMVIPGLASYDHALSYHTVEQVVRIALFATCVVAALRTPADVRAFCLGWVAIMVAYECKALWEYALHGRGVYQMGLFRMIGIEKSHGDPNTFSGKVVLLVPLLVLIHATARNALERWAVVGSLVLGGIIVVLTGSRGAMLCAVFLGGLYALLSRRRVQVVAIVGCAALVAALVLPDAILDRYGTLLDPSSNESARISAEGRWIGMRKGLELFSIHPVLGVGPGVFPDSSRYVGEIPGEVIGLQPHNLLGQMLGEHGLVGAIGFGVLLAGALSSGFALLRLRGRDGPAAHLLAEVGRCGLLCYAVLTFQGIGAHNFRSYNWIWIAALLLATARVARTAELPDSAARRLGRLRVGVKRRGSAAG